MKYQSTERNLVDVVSMFSKLSLMQLYTFFRPVCKPETIYQYVVNQSRNNHMRIVNDKYVVWKDSLAYSPHWEEALENAFWIVANFGCDKIQELRTGEFPTIVSFNTVDRAAYDISYITNMAYAENARKKIERDRKIRKNSGSKEPDPYYHICLVPYENLGERCKGYNFDSYCVLDKSGRIPKPVYHLWDE